MITAKDILDYVQTLAPRETMEPWDNCGLLCGSSSAPVSRVLVALDPFEDVCREAIDTGAQLLLTHHPLIFQPLKALTDETPVGRCLQLLCTHGIGAINAHTNLDVASGGVNDELAARLGLQEAKPLLLPGKSWGLLRVGTVEDQPLPDFLSHVKDALGCPGLRYVCGGANVHRVAVGGGACGSELMDAIEAGCDTFVTADVKYNQFRDAYDYGINLIDAGHYYTERPVVDVLAEKLCARFPELTVLISRKNQDCMKFL